MSRADVAQWLAIVAGWVLLTWPAADVVGTWHPWAVSGGLFLLSLAGWKHLWVLFTAGVYTLTQGGRDA